MGNGDRMSDEGKIVTLYGTVKFETLSHVTNDKNTLLTTVEGVPIIPFFIVERQLVEEYIKWGLPLPTRLNKVGNLIIKRVIGSQIPISSLYPKLKSPNYGEVTTGSVLGKKGVAGFFDFKLPINLDAPIEEFDMLFGCLKSLGDVGIGADRTFGFGECNLTLNAVNRKPIKKVGVFKELWDNKLFKPSPVPKRLRLKELVIYSINLMKWIVPKGNKWYSADVKFLLYRKKLQLPEVECRKFIYYNVEGVENIDMHFIYDLRRYCRKVWKDMGKNPTKYFGGRLYHNLYEYTPYEAMAKFKPFKIFVEGKEEEVNELTDFICSTIDGKTIIPEKYDKEVKIEVVDVKTKKGEDYFKLNHWEN